jgi:hypothetical protein
VIGVGELFQLAPANTAFRKPVTADAQHLFPSPVKAMGYWGSHNQYTQPGSFDERVSRNMEDPRMDGLPSSPSLGSLGGSRTVSRLGGSRSQPRLAPLASMPPNMTIVTSPL